MKESAKAWGCLLLVALISFMVFLLPTLAYKAGHHH